MERLSEDRAREMLTKPHLILTAEFAAEVNVVGQRLPLEQPLYPLVLPWYRRALPDDIVRVEDDWRAHRIEMLVPDIWIELMENMDSKKRSHLGRLLENFLWTGARTVGQTLDVAANKGVHFGVGNIVGKPFALLAFARPHEESIEEPIPVFVRDC